ncbi:hypothetical protein QZH41_002440 [Actinostola sp. cb2023]|nr:hypothetical protein QZH41_002440 [Actinostola sp. cb2023]
MSNETMPKINERSFTNYDWAHTSYLPGMTALPDQVDDVDEPPRLMLDDESNSSDGEENEGYVSDENPTSPNFPRAVSHLSLAKDGSMKPLETSDTLSTIAPPLYDNVITDQTKYTETAHIYDNADDMDPNIPRQPNPARSPTEPLYSTVE